MTTLAEQNSSTKQANSASNIVFLILARFAKWALIFIFAGLTILVTVAIGLHNAGIDLQDERGSFIAGTTAELSIEALIIALGTVFIIDATRAVRKELNSSK